MSARLPATFNARGPRPDRGTGVPSPASTRRRDPVLAYAASARRLLAKISALIDGTDLEGL